MSAVSVDHESASEFTSEVSAAEHRSASVHYPPALYAAVHGGNPGDIAFYRERCRGARAVLELGCGSGRVSSVLAAAGCAVVGLDRDWHALSHARSPGYLRVCADMVQFGFSTRFERVVIPYNGLCCLLTSAALVTCLQGAARHLAAGGRVVFDVYNADGMEAWPQPPPPAESDLGEVRVGDETWRVSERSTVDLASQRVDATYIHRRVPDGLSVVATIAQRYLLSRDLHELLDAAGLVVEAVHGGFRGEPFGDEAAHLVVTAARREQAAL